MRAVLGVILAALLGTAALAQRPADTPLGVIVEVPPRPPQFIAAVPAPDNQRRFVAVVDDFARRYTESRDSGQRVAVVLGRAEALCEARPRGITGWVGTVETIQRDARWVRLTVRVSDRVRITNDVPINAVNFNNIIGYTDGFLGPTFAALREGQRIRFNATLQGGYVPGQRGQQECFSYANTSESGRMEQPRLVGSFADIALMR